MCTYIASRLDRRPFWSTVTSEETNTILCQLFISRKRKSRKKREIERGHTNTTGEKRNHAVLSTTWLALLSKTNFLLLLLLPSPRRGCNAKRKFHIIGTMPCIMLYTETTVFEPHPMRLTTKSSLSLFLLNTVLLLWKRREAAIEVFI